MLLLNDTNTIARMDVVPPRTVKTLKENVQWITERATFDGTSKAHGPR
jgi:hypothetical protein